MDVKKTQRTNKTQNNNVKKAVTFPKIGDVLENRFQITEILGEGAFSVSYKVFDQSIKLDKALKVFGLYTEVFYNLTEIRKEANIYKTVTHDNVPIFYELYESDYVFFEMEYINGSNLRTLLNKGIEKKDKIDIALQLSQALYQLHFCEVEHKDLKPENILIGENQKV
ncbi:MAG: protein kinase, partial [Candidatus Cloacimonetes bacterium]|nr:protein kinase [Candidatus Cloacimonadota bacterium]